VWEELERRGATVAVVPNFEELRATILARTSWQEIST
jgi:hypothetical protein